MSITNEQNTGDGQPKPADIPNAEGQNLAEPTVEYDARETTTLFQKEPTLDESFDTSQEAPSDRKAMKWVGGGALALLLAGGSVFALTQNSDKPQKAAVTLDAGSNEPPVTTPTTVETSPTPAETATETYTPIFITGSTAEEIIEQYTYNRDCAHNSRDSVVQLDCLEHYVGNFERSGELAANIMDTITELAIYRQSNPDFDLEITTELLDSRFNGNVFEAVVVDTDHSGTFHRKLRFGRTSAVTEDLTVEGNVDSIWLLREVKAVQPGEINFG